MNLTQKQWTKSQKTTSNSVIIDVRTPEEYSLGHLKDSMLLNIRNPQVFMDGLAKLDISKSYFVYCRSGSRSEQACHIMKTKGITKCYNLIGGIIEWEGQINH